MTTFVSGLDLQETWHPGSAGRARDKTAGSLLHDEIRDPVVLRIAKQWPFGPVDQFRGLLWPHGDRHLLLRLFDQADDASPRAAP